MKYQITNVVTGEVTYSDDFNYTFKKAWEDGLDGEPLYEIVILDQPLDILS